MSRNKYDNLSKFMINLAQDPAQLQSFKTHPTSLMAQSNLNPEEQAIVLSRDPDDLDAALKPNAPKGPIIIVFRVVDLL